MNASAFSRKMSDFCRARLTPLLPPREAERVRKYVVGLVNARTPPRRTGKESYAWGDIAASCGLATETMQTIAPQLRPALDAIVRELPGLPNLKPKKPPAASMQPRSPRTKTKSASPTAVRPAPTQAEPGHAAETQQTKQKAKKPAAPRPAPIATVPFGPERRKHGRRPRPVVEFPEPLWSQLVEPRTFRDALRLQMRRHNDSLNSLSRALQALGSNIDSGTINNWLRCKRVPQALTSITVLKLIERRYRLAEGYFRSRLPNRNHGFAGHKIEGITPSEQRRLAWHLPDDFDQRPSSEREEIVAWVRQNIISGTTEYRAYQAAALRQRYALQFSCLSTGGTWRHSDEDLDGAEDTDPELAWGSQPAPLALDAEMSRLVHFKMSTLAAAGYSRSGVWGQETASQKMDHLGLMFGALAAPPRSAVRGLGVPLASLTLAMLVFPAVWDWYVQWRERRRGFYTSWETGMLSLGLALVRIDTGWLRQCPELAQQLVPVDGLISEAEIEAVRADWRGACDAAYKHCLSRAKEIQRVARIHRDPFEPILAILEAASPVGEYRKIAEEIASRMPSERHYPRAAAEAVRSILMIRLGMHLGIRQKNMRQMLVRDRGELPSSERHLIDRKCGELRWNAREQGWEVFIPAAAFKNAGSSYFNGRPFRIILPDLGGLYRYIDSYLSRHRAVLLQRADDPRTFFVKTVKMSSRQAAYNQNTYYEAWRLTIQRYGIYNPFTKRGAIKGLLPHGPHNIRDILATHILKITGSFEQASYAIQDTPETVAKHYGRFLPQDKAALAANVLNKVWETA